jgi:hypothetical protein
VGGLASDGSANSGHDEVSRGTDAFTLLSLAFKVPSGYVVLNIHPRFGITQSDMVGGCKPSLLFPACLKGLDGGTLSNLEGNVVSAPSPKDCAHDTHCMPRRPAMPVVFTS